MPQVYYNNVLHNIKYYQEINITRLHRENNKPAYIDDFGNKSWYTNGIIHRECDGPACTNVDGSKEWYKNGQRHREGICLQLFIQM